jgi:signal transduction histidine kinase
VRRPRWELIDLAVALAVASAIALEASFSVPRHGPVLANVACCLALAVPLGLRRRLPLGAAAGVLVLAVFQSAFLTPLAPLVTPFLLAIVPPYAAGAYASRVGRSLVGLAICLAGGVALELAVPAAVRNARAIMPVSAVVLLAWASGRLVAARTSRMYELERLADALLEARRARERLAVAEQRAHVARELHDIVAHSMTVICLQAGAAQRVWDAHREQHCA